MLLASHSDNDHTESTCTEISALAWELRSNRKWWVESQSLLVRNRTTFHWEVIWIMLVLRVVNKFKNPNSSFFFNRLLFWFLALQGRWKWGYKHITFQSVDTRQIDPAHRLSVCYHSYLPHKQLSCPGVCCAPASELSLSEMLMDLGPPWGLPALC